MIVRRGFRRAASFHDDRLRTAPVGHFFDAITNGWGAMPSYAPQIPVQDRWAIIAYVRALQASQNIKTSTPSGSAAQHQRLPEDTNEHFTIVQTFRDFEGSQLLSVALPWFYC
jgi:hypothetical protein